MKQVLKLRYIIAAAILGLLLSQLVVETTHAQTAVCQNGYYGFFWSDGSGHCSKLGDTKTALAQPTATPVVVTYTAPGDPYWLVYGDTLSGLATRWGVTLEDLVAYNHIEGYQVNAGDMISRPTVGYKAPVEETGAQVNTSGYLSTIGYGQEYYVQQGDTWDLITSTWGTSVEAIRGVTGVYNFSYNLYVGQRLVRPTPEYTAIIDALATSTPTPIPVQANPTSTPTTAPPTPTLAAPVTHAATIAASANLICTPAGSSYILNVTITLSDLTKFKQASLFVGGQSFVVSSLTYPIVGNVSTRPQSAMITVVYNDNSFDSLYFNSINSCQ